MDRIAEENPAAVIILGDLVYQADAAGHWELFDSLTTALRTANIPVFPLLGNHDYYGCNDVAFAQRDQRFPHIGNRRWYAFAIGGITFVLTDSNFEEMTNNEFDVQRMWFNSILDSCERNEDTRMIIVGTHHPPFTNSTVVHDDTLVQAIFLPGFRSHRKARLFFSGHCHAYERFEKDGKQFIVSGGGGGPRQRLKAGADAKHEDSFRWNSAYRPFHFCRLVSSDKGLTFEMVGLNEEQNTLTVLDSLFVGWE